MENQNNLQKSETEEEKPKEEEKKVDPIIQMEINKSTANIQKIYDKNILLERKLNQITQNIQKEIQNNHDVILQNKKLLKELNKEIENQQEIKTGINNDMKNLENLITFKIKQIQQISKMNRGKDSVERGKKELFNYQSSEELLNVKQKQLKNLAKTNTIVEKDISKITDNLQKGYYIDETIKEEKPSIRTKSDELNYKLSKLNTNIDILKNEILILKNIKRNHDINCEKKMDRLNKELDNLKDKKMRTINYGEFIDKKNEVTALKRKHIEEYRMTETKNRELFKLKDKNKTLGDLSIRTNTNKPAIFLTENQYKNGDSPYEKTHENYNTINHIQEEDDNSPNNRKERSNYNPKKNKSYYDMYTNTEYNNKQRNNSNLNNKRNKFNSGDDDDEGNDMVGELKNNSDNEDNASQIKNLKTEKDYQEKYNTMIDDKNEFKRKKLNKLKEANAQRIEYENKMKEMESKRLKVQSKNYDLTNMKNVNESKIKKLNNQIIELKAEKEKYDKQISRKDQAKEELASYAEEIKSIDF